MFKPTFTDPTFILWHDRGLKCFRDLYRDGVFCSFADLAREFNLTLSHLFRYFQFRNCAKSLFPAFPHPPPEQVWDEFLGLNPLQKSLVSTIYCTMQSYDGLLTTRTKEAWERELGFVLDEHWWDAALNTIHRSSICARLTLIQFKVLLRCHFSKTNIVVSNIPNHNRCL